MEKLDNMHNREIAKNVFWLGYPDNESGLTNNPYLIVDGEECVLIDPGPGHPLFRDIIILKIQEVCKPSSIRYIIVQHSGSDVCGIIPYIENYLHPDVVILCHPSASQEISYYGIRHPVFAVGDGDRLQLQSGKMLKFFHAPYLASPETIITYDEREKILFTSELFSASDSTWRSEADDEYVPLAREFLEQEIASRDALNYAYNVFSQLEINWILPQHGAAVSKEFVPKFLELLKTEKIGSALEGLGATLSAEHKAQFVRIIRDVLGDETDEYALDADISVIAAQISRKNPDILPVLIPKIHKKSMELGIQNPLTHNRIYTSESLKNVQGSKVVSTMRNRMVNAQYALGDTAFVNVGQDDHQLVASEENMAIMFIDIRHFTAWCDEHDPKEVVARLSYEYETITKLVGKYNGRINKIMGDGVLAYFPETAVSECLFAAQHIQMEVARSERLLGVGIGIDFGRVIIGDFGEHTRLDFTVIGRTVNQAARMCALAGEDFIAMHDVFFNALSDHVRQKIETLSSFEKKKVRVKPSDPELDAVIFKASDLAPSLRSATHTAHS